MVRIGDQYMSEALVRFILTAIVVVLMAAFFFAKNAYQRWSKERLKQRLNELPDSNLDRAVRALLVHIVAHPQDWSFERTKQQISTRNGEVNIKSHFFSIEVAGIGHLTRSGIKPEIADNTEHVVKQFIELKLIEGMFAHITPPPALDEEKRVNRTKSIMTSIRPYLKQGQ